MKCSALCLGLLAALTLATPVYAIGTNFSYQGALQDAGVAANGSYDLEFRLQTQAGAPIGSPVVKDNVAVAQGVFSVELDFGPVIASADYQLQIGVRAGVSSGAFTALTPATRITSTPQAQVATIAAEAVTVSPGSINSASIVDGSVGTSDINSAQVQRRIAASCASGQSIRVVNADGTVTCESSSSGPVGPQGPVGPAGAAGPAGATGAVGPQGTTGAQGPVGAQGVAGPQGAIGPQGTPGSADAWGRLGNAGTNSTMNFIGTTDSTPLFIRAFNLKVAEFRPNTTGGVNMVLGVGNSINASQSSAGQSVISGGTTNVINSGSFATIGGGDQNSVTNTGATIGGGTLNTANGSRSTVSGGFDNKADGFRSTVSGGSSNCAGGDYSWAGGKTAQIRAGNEANDGNCTGTSSGDADGDNGTFAWSDSQAGGFNSTGANQFLVRAQGGMGLNTATLGAAFDLRSSELVVRNGVIGDNTDITLLNDTNRGYLMASIPGTAGAAGRFFITQVDARIPNVVFLNLLEISANGDFSVTANAFKPGGGAWSVASDARLKTEVSTLDGSLDRLLALRGVNFSYRADAPKALIAPGPQIGFIAQQVEQVFPQWISERDGYKTIGIQGFEALTVEALRELRNESAVIDGAQAAQLQALAESNAALAAENNELRSRLDALEALIGKYKARPRWR